MTGLVLDGCPKSTLPGIVPLALIRLQITCTLQLCYRYTVNYRQGRTREAFECHCITLVMDSAKREGRAV
jgi:hypothetical protein